MDLQSCFVSTVQVCTEHLRVLELSLLIQQVQQEMKGRKEAENLSQKEWSPLSNHMYCGGFVACRLLTEQL